ncbi:restriction endonuclease subunit S [Vibrio parahaemolyticus]|uniref:restriction endonuclease subunit S n=1 Tax=Vibrio parahaemolyticus TaxID=670 RepID=UPI0015BE240E|nr:restriction endonuclease subunit S [Vibrio parahaemolyticus]QLE28233.1 restriction endonuclease subunit S [Vibrio parahaemolyticus]HCE1880388.1 restriction endonuclease subunit S [Vibrio parahaemolyticus]HCE3645065.1 restriction endonuclease subunit S [Vibrio parahaemolyticus]HCE4535064.1 restriction endonuclease subunit S [Vibrio parahaemolyticus]
MGKYQAYPEYKDSGIDWLETIPAHWSTSKLRYTFSFGKGLTITKENLRDTGTPCVSYGEVHSKYGFEIDPARHPLKCVGDEYLKTSSYALLKKGDIVFADTSEDIDGSGNFTQLVSNEQVFAGYHTIIARPYNRECSRYYAYLLDSKELRTQIRHAVKGVKVFSITQAILRGVNIWLPPLEERTQIANFLDHETAKIDTMIEKQQQLIKLLKEKRQAVISHAVTKGLNPQAPMKNSGVEWLGEVPEHWVVTRAKYVSNIFVPQRNKPELNDTQGVAWATMEDMKQQYISDTSKYVSSQSALAAGSKTLKAGSVIASCVGNFGITSINKVDVIINQQLQAFQPFNIKAEYLQSIVVLSKQYFELIGTAATLVYVNQEGFENLPVLVPPEKEQNDICEYVLEKSTSFDLLIEKSVIQTSLLKERRTALISAAVTGKIDVRDFDGVSNDA